MRLKKAANLITINLLVTVGLLIAAEGIASITLLLYRVFKTPLIIAERRHTQYDEQLGWVNIPNLYIENMYGTGIYLKTNSQASRNEKNFSTKVPHKKVRIVCSGDSFTFGNGVSNNRTWCHLLTELIEDLETVNIGQGGYGVDQIYLRYKRDGESLEHNIHIFAFITWDFPRMQSTTFAGYGKPILNLVNGQLKVGNSPVPKRSFYSPKLTQSLGFLRQELRVVEFFNQLVEKISSPKKDFDFSREFPDQNSQAIIAAILDDLKTMSQQNNNTFILVYLPVKPDYFGLQSTYLWKQYFKIVSKEKGIIFIDLVDELRQLPPQEIESLFIPGDGHYSNKGNEYIADRLSKKLLTIPDIMDRSSSKKSASIF